MNELILWCYHCKLPIGNTAEDDGEELRCPICSASLEYIDMDCDIPDHPVVWEVEPLVNDRQEHLFERV